MVGPLVRTAATAGAGRVTLQTGEENGEVLLCARAIKTQALVLARALWRRYRGGKHSA
jgi:hypothetical protein